VIVLWRSCRGRLYGFYAPDDTEDLRSSERNHVGERADPSIACVDGGLVLEHTLAAPAFIAWSVRCRPADVEANPNSSIGSRHDNGGRLDISAEAQRKAGRRIESLLENCPEPNTFIARASEIDQMSSARALIVGIGGAARPNSSSEYPLKTNLRAAENAGAETVLISGRELRKHAQIAPAVPHEHEGELETASGIHDRGGWT
jgi:hypothetical protein